MLRLLRAIMYYAPDDIGGGGEEIEEREDIEEEESERLYAGKYKTVEDMEVAYKEAESKMAAAAQEAADLRLQQQYAQTTAQPAQANNYAEQFNEKIYEDAHGAVSELVLQTQLRQRAIEKAATANLKRSVGQFKDDPLFGHIKDEFEAEMLAIDDSVLADPAQAARAAQFIYNAVAGQYARTQAGKAKSDPGERRAFVRSFGVEEPEASLGDDADRMTRDDEMMLREMGLSDAKTRNEIAEAAKKSGGGTRERY